MVEKDLFFNKHLEWNFYSGTFSKFSQIKKLKNGKSCMIFEKLEFKRKGFFGIKDFRKTIKIKINKTNIINDEKV